MEPPNTDQKQPSELGDNQSTNNNQLQLIEDNDDQIQETNIEDEFNNYREINNDDTNENAAATPLGLDQDGGSGGSRFFDDRKLNTRSSSQIIAANPPNQSAQDHHQVVKLPAIIDRSSKLQANKTPNKPMLDNRFKMNHHIYQNNKFQSGSSSHAAIARVSQSELNNPY